MFVSQGGVQGSESKELSHWAPRQAGLIPEAQQAASLLTGHGFHISRRVRGSKAGEGV